MNKLYSGYFKRGFDLFFAIICLVIAIPVFIIILFILLPSGKPFYFQSRPGKYEKEIRVIKFRTMNSKKNPEGSLLPDHKRITKTGRILRALSLDELPQLINIIKGDMSFIGPRPLLMKYLPLYSPEQKRRHHVLPGLTGWAQVNGRNSISWNEKFKLDVWYVDNISFGLDVKIIWMTFIKVIKREGIDSGDNTTMEPFTGNN
jgi:undecaprenyl phosphate N,N'-diacetylbacillosamine 1-phosphate transferase